MRLGADSVKGERDATFTICVESVTIAAIRTFIDRFF
jgi:hypothetical protein